MYNEIILNVHDAHKHTYQKFCHSMKLIFSALSPTQTLLNKFDSQWRSLTSLTGGGGGCNICGFTDEQVTQSPETFLFCSAR